MSADIWDGCDTPRRTRRAASPMPVHHTKAAVAHAHLTFAETPAMYLREEMV